MFKLGKPPLLLQRRNLLQSQIQARKDKRRRRMLGDMVVPYRILGKSRDKTDAEE